MTRRGFFSTLIFAASGCVLARTPLAGAADYYDRPGAPMDESWWTDDIPPWPPEDVRFEMFQCHKDFSVCFAHDGTAYILYDKSRSRSSCPFGLGEDVKF